MTAKENNGTPIRCECGKVIAKYRNGRIYLWCKACRKEVELTIEKVEPFEPLNFP